MIFVERRHYLWSVGLIVTTAGCVELESAAFGDGSGEDDNVEDDDDDPIDDEELERVRNMLSAAEVEVLTLKRDGDGFFLEIQTSGNTDRDVNRVASAFSSVATDVEGDLSVRIEDRGLTDGTFEIEHEWAEEHNQGAITDGEYMARVMETLD